jgi:hypothetical protein
MYINTFQTKTIKTMNVSRLIPFLPVLLLLLPVPSGAAPIVPSTNQTRMALNPSDLCPLVQIVEHELCDNVNVHNNFTDLCVLLHNYNTSFCSKNVEVVAHHAPLSNAGLSVLTLEHEFLNNKGNDIHKLCPILNFIDEELCTSLHHPHVDFQFYPKQLCPLLNITYQELCA